jgi:hypothetical protein
MPYANPEEKKAADRRRYKERYETERGFARKEAERKSRYYAENPRYAARVKAKVLAGRKKVKAISKKVVAKRKVTAKKGAK